MKDDSSFFQIFEVKRFLISSVELRLYWILSSDKYVKVYNSMDFNRLVSLDFAENTEIMALSVEGTFLSLIKVKDLNLPFKALINNTELIKIDNMKFLLNSPISAQSTRDIEKIYTYIKENFSEDKEEPKKLTKKKSSEE